MRARPPAHSDRREDPPSRAKRENQSDRREDRSRERSDRATRSREPEGRTVRSTKKRTSALWSSLRSDSASAHSLRSWLGGLPSVAVNSQRDSGNQTSTEGRTHEPRGEADRAIRIKQRKEKREKHSRAGVREAREFAEGQLVRDLGQKRRLGSVGLVGPISTANHRAQRQNVRSDELNGKCSTSGKIHHHLLLSGSIYH